MKPITFLFTLLLSLTTLVQRPHQPSSAEIFQGIQKLDVVGNVLYLAAHPDDENTRFIAYCANELHLNTAYLSLTRGDGGQNLVGPELREELGIIRTQELLAARRVDGGSQYFSRANDFGYSKTPEETLAIWDKDLILSDVVRVIRQFKPDVIVCRFPTDGGGGHGHHTASALLGVEAFDLAGDETVYPEQVEKYGVWQPKRIVVNTGRWWNDEISADDPGVVTADIGAYSSVLGTSCNEIAARSRTMHKSQGFGSTGVRGQQIEYFEHLKGEEASDDLFDGVDLSWSRVKGASTIATKIKVLKERFEMRQPEKSISGLLELRRELGIVRNNAFAAQKIKEVDRLIQACAGLYVEAVADDYSKVAGDSLYVDIEVISRTTDDLKWNDLSSSAFDFSKRIDTRLALNQKIEERMGFVIPETIASAQPYWLRDEGTLGTYTVKADSLIGTPENAPAISFDLDFTYKGQDYMLSVPLVYKWNDPVQGERHRPFIVTPPVAVDFAEGSYLVSGENSQEVVLVVKAMQEGYMGKLKIDQVDGWDVRPRELPLIFEKKGEEQRYTITVRPGANAGVAELRTEVKSFGNSYRNGLREIDYDHIPTQVYMPSSMTRLVYLDLPVLSGRIGYIAGAGDVMPESLRGIGYTVDELATDALSAEDLSQYDAIITGIRLLNVDERVDFYMGELLRYAENGGTLILQYNTRHRLKTDNFSPYPLKLSRDRVTEEDAKVTFLKPDHSVLNYPNKLSERDFEGWVQERGLYFPSEWDEQYETILSWHDTGEDAKEGSLLVAKTGEGHYVYTGISFFRELPAGVPGAYRLLVNLIELGND